MSTTTSQQEAVGTLKAFQAELSTYREQLAKLQEMGGILQKDLLDCAKLAMGEGKTDSGSRSFVRAVFALIEGGVFNLKQIALKLSEHGKGNFSKAELLMLEEITYDLDERGKAQAQTKFIRLPRNIKFAFEAAARAFGTSYVLNVGDSGWSSFQEALKIRNRITHPKSIEDLQLSGQDVDEVEAAARWFLRNQTSVIQTLLDRMQVLSDKLTHEKPHNASAA